MLAYTSLRLRWNEDFPILDTHPWIDLNPQTIHSGKTWPWNSTELPQEAISETFSKYKSAFRNSAHTFLGISSHPDHVDIAWNPCKVTPSYLSHNSVNISVWKIGICFGKLSNLISSHIFANPPVQNTGEPHAGYSGVSVNIISLLVQGEFKSGRNVSSLFF